MSDPSTSPHLYQHGPCASGATLVRDCLDGLPPTIASAVRDRLDEGERKYGASLKVGWGNAALAGYQEALDGIAYAIAASDSVGVTQWVALAQHQRELMRAPDGDFGTD